MGRYTAIADVGQAIIRLLQEGLCPEPLSNPDSVALCSPADRGDTVLGLYLYEVNECEAMRAVNPVPMGNRQLRQPPMLLQLHFMLTVYSAAEIKFRALDEQRILGRAMQILADNSVLDAASTLGDVNPLERSIRIQIENLSMEDKMRLWGSSNSPYRLSACYKVEPIEIESTRVRTVQRVVQVQMGQGE